MRHYVHPSGIITKYQGSHGQRTYLCVFASLILWALPKWSPTSPCTLKKKEKTIQLAIDNFWNKLSLNIVTQHNLQLRVIQTTRYNSHISGYSTQLTQCNWQCDSYNSYYSWPWCISSKMRFHLSHPFQKYCFLWVPVGHITGEYMVMRIWIYAYISFCYGQHYVYG